MNRAHYTTAVLVLWVELGAIACTAASAHVVHQVTEYESALARVVETERAWLPAYLEGE